MARYDLARFRREHNLTQKQLAEALSVTQGFLSSVENGRTSFPEERRKDFEKAFPNVNLNDYRYIEDVAEEVREWEPQKRRGFLASLHDTINKLFSVYTDEEFDEEFGDKPSSLDSEAGLGYGGMRQTHVEPRDEHELTENEEVPENWRREVAKVLTENNEMNNYISKLRIDNEVLSAKADELREKLFSAHNTIFDLQNEILRLKSLLIANNVTEIDLK